MRIDFVCCSLFCSWMCYYCFCEVFVVLYGVVVVLGLCVDVDFFLDLFIFIFRVIEIVGGSCFYD